MPHVVHPLLKDGVEARGYQLRSLERILSFSSLMVMPTGFGKTAVEWMAMAEFLKKGAQKIVLIAPTTGLVDQQMTMAKERLNLEEERVVAYTGDTGPDKRKALWERAIFGNQEPGWSTGQVKTFHRILESSTKVIRPVATSTTESP